MIEIIRAQPQGAALLKEIAVAAKGYWGYPDHLMAKFAQSPIITPESIVADTVFIAQVDAVTVGWYRLLTGAETTILDDLWVLPACMGRGVGRTLFTHAVEQARGQGAQAIELEADPNAAPFYICTWAAG
jgi:GNAT superfamily N-acetyltransferase